jgi:hypothetical protein
MPTAPKACRRLIEQFPMSRREVVSLAGIAHPQDAIAFFPKSETDCVGMAFSRKATATTSVPQVAT